MGSRNIATTEDRFVLYLIKTKTKSQSLEKRTLLVIKAEGQCDADKPCNPHKFDQSYVTDTSSHALGDHLRPEVLYWPLIGQRL